MEQLFNLDSDIYSLLKIIVVVITFLAFLAKIKNYFSYFHKRQTLKLDIEILNSIESRNDLNIKLIWA